MYKYYQHNCSISYNQNISLDRLFKLTQIFLQFMTQLTPKYTYCLVLMLLVWILHFYSSEGKKKYSTVEKSLHLSQNLPYPFYIISKLQFSSDAHLCLTLCDSTDCSTPGSPVHHQLLELTQTHVHWVGDAIQPSHPLSFPSPPDFHLSQDQGLF